MARKGKKSTVRTAKKSQSNSVPKAHARMLKAIDQEMEAGHLENALKYAEQLTAETPGLPAAWEKLSNIYAKSERARDAVEAFKKCIMCLGASTEATELKLSQYEIMAGWSAQAIDRLSALCNKHPKNKKNWQHLSRAYHETGKNQEALAANDEAYALDAEDDGVLMLRCGILDQLQRASEAKKTAAKLKEIAPNKINVSNYLGSLELREGNYIAAEKHFSDEMEVAESSMAAYNKFISWHYNPEVPTDIFKKEAVKWYERFKVDKQGVRASTLVHINKKIKIGLLSGGFRTHPVGQMIYPALANINQTECELIVFSTHQVEDSLTAKIKSSVGQWHSVSGLSDIELDRFIRDCDIDILIDMNGGGEGSRFRMLTHEPAPIIVKWVGILINTTGLKCIDYLLSDNIETPGGVDENYTEKLIRLPNDYICYHIPDYAPTVNELPAKKNGYITFGCLNNPAKLSDPLIGEWCKVLQETPGSKLLLKNTQFEGEEFRQKTRDRFANFGIEEDRLILDGPEKHSEFLKAYHCIDIALDTWPYSGGLTTCEALMMGVPVVTCTGPTFAGRHSATHLVNAGLHELVTDNWEDFHRRVKELTSDIESLSTIRSALRTIIQDSPLCNGKLFADHFTTAMRAIWQRHCEGKAPEALTMDKEGHAQFEDEYTPVVLESVENTSDQSADWSLDEPVIVVDNAALMPKHHRFSELLQSGNMAIMSFDPGSQYTKQAEDLKALGEWHHHPHALLGDGSQKKLYVTLDPEKTGTLKPLPPEQLPESNRKDMQLLAELPIDTVRLDDIEGLPTLNLLMLDDLNNPLDVLRNASSYFNELLIIQIRVAFHKTHLGQADFHEILSYSHYHGYRFYCFNNKNYLSLLGQAVSGEKVQETDMLSADVVLLPSFERMDKLTDKQCLKLAFLLHSVYGIKDMAYRLLAGIDESKGEEYFFREGFAKKNIETIMKREVTYDPSQLECNQREFTLCVGIPVYNEEKYIRETIQSLKVQDYKDVKFLVADNCSTDRTLDIIREETIGDERFDIFQQAYNVGALRNFEFLFSNTKSKYFMWLGAHDVLSNNYLSLAVEEIDKVSDIAMVMGKPMAIGETSNLIGFVKDAVYDFASNKKEERYLKSVAELANCTVLHSVFVRKALEDFEFRVTISPDHVLISHLLWHGKLKNIKDASYFRRYFNSRNESQTERIGGAKATYDRTEFFKYYLDDLSVLSKGSNYAGKKYFSNKVSKVLEARFL